MSFRDYLKEQTITEDVIETGEEYNQDYDYGVQEGDIFYVKAFAPDSNEFVRLSGNIASLSNELSDYIDTGYKIVKCTTGWEEDLGIWKNAQAELVTESVQMPKRLSKEQLDIIQNRSKKMEDDFQDEVFRLINSGGVEQKNDEYPLSTIFKVALENLADKWTTTDKTAYRSLKKF